MSVVVSQGCRPVGSPRTVTAVRGNIISQLDGERPLDVLRQVFSEAAEKDQELMRVGVMLGHAISSDERDWGRGGFLIRGLMGADAGSGALAVTGSVSLNDTVQFTCATRRRLRRTWSCFSPRRRLSRKRPARCCSPAMVEARECTADPTAISQWSVKRSGARCLSAGSSAAASLDPSAGPTSCTDIRPAW